MNTQSQKELQPGDMFGGRYKIVRMINQGNFGRVYEAVQTVHGVELRHVALKVFKEEQINSDTARDSFQDAVMLIRMMEDFPAHEVWTRLVEILDGGVVLEGGQNQFYLTMELVHGKPLDSVLKQFGGLPGVGGLQLDLAVHYLQEILIPLAWMHTLPMPAVHADLHFGNVLVITKGSVSSSKMGSVKLVDFGLAQHLPGPVTGGALKCQAPETLSGGLGDTRSDVYAVGIMWYELLTGQYPFQDERTETTGLELAALSAEVDAMKQKLKEGGEPGLTSRTVEAKEQERNRKQQEHIAAMLAARKRPYTQASEINEQLRSALGLEDILNRCLYFSPARRFFDAAELKKSLEKYLAGEVDPPLVDGAQSMHVDQAYRLAARGQFVQAQEEADKAIALQPGNYAGWLAKARISLVTSKGEPDKCEHHMDQANAFLAKAQALAPEEPLVFDAWAEFHQADGRSGSAEKMKNQADILRRSRTKGK